MAYNWQLDDWPNFRFDLSGLQQDIMLFAEKTGQLTGMLRAVPGHIQAEAAVEIMVSEAINTSAIEGEFLNRQEVFSSVRRRMGFAEDYVVKDKRASAIGKLMSEVRKDIPEPLTEEILLHWHQVLFEGNGRVKAGKWRSHTDPMQVISGAIGKEVIHFEAPPSNIIPAQMAAFIQWFNDTANGAANEISVPAVRAAIAHLYFESIHPFEDGNGRIGRAIAEKALSQGMGRPSMLSLSKTIEAAKSEYYHALKQAQRSNEITAWLHYFMQVILAAQTDTEALIEFTLRKLIFFNKNRTELNNRQLQAINKMLDAGPKGFEGGMNAAKYMSITKASKATATRDLQDLAEKNIFVATGGGRSTRYLLHLP